MCYASARIIVDVVFLQQITARQRGGKSGKSVMNKIFRALAVMMTVIFAAGCANKDIKPVDVICPVLGGIAGAAIAAGAVDSDDSEGAMAGGAAIGAGLAWFLCKDREEPAPPPKPITQSARWARAAAAPSIT